MDSLSEPINEVYATLAGPVNEFMVQKLFHGFQIAINNCVQRVHLLMHSTGGFVNDGVAMYNFMRKLPIEIISYNAGSVQSIAVIAFLCAQKCKASKTATFMIHRSHFSSQMPASSAQLQAITDSMTIDNTRMEEILREHLTMPEDKWTIHNNADLFLTAEEALKYGLIDEITDFAPPLGASMFNVLE